MARVEWPPELVPQASQWGLIPAHALSLSSFSGAAEVLITGPSRWGFTVSTTPALAGRRDMPAHLRRERWDAFIHSLRNGVNTVRAWDWRDRITLGRDPERPSVYRQMLLMSSHWQHWGRAIAHGSVSGNTLTVSATNDYYDLAAVPAVAGRAYCFAVDVRSPTPAHLTLGLGDGTHGTVGALFRATTGTIDHRIGGALAGRYGMGSGWSRVWVAAPAIAAGALTVHLYVLNPAGAAVQLRRPQLSEWGAVPLYTQSHGSPIAGSNLPTPFVVGAGQSGSALVTSGWLPGSPLERGGKFEVGGELKVLLSDTVADGGGGATLSFEPPMRRTPSNGAPVRVERPRAEFRLRTDRAGFMQTGHVADSLDLTFEEVTRVESDDESDYADDYAEDYAG